jgi:hypothetical protein
MQKQSLSRDIALERLQAEHQAEHSFCNACPM